MSKQHRVVVTGMGVVAPNGVGLKEFTHAIRQGESGLRFDPELEKLGFSCCVSGRPPISDEQLWEVLPENHRNAFKSTGIAYALMAGLEAWSHAGLQVDPPNRDPDSGIVFGAGVSSVEKTREVAYAIDEGKVRRLRSNTVPQTMSSGPSAYLSTRLHLGNWVSSNSSACATGTESILLAFQRIQSGKAKRMLAGACSDAGPYIWGPFDALRVLNRHHNDCPEEASRPLASDANGFIPGAGGAALVLESLESAQERGAEIMGEILGGAVNCGGQIDGGTMTAPNPTAVQECIAMAMQDAKVDSSDIDVINGHLTATAMDAMEVANWAKALKRDRGTFPVLHSLKSLIGHTIAAAGAIETVAALICLQDQFVFGNANVGKLNPDVLKWINADRIPQKAVSFPHQTVIKANFGFGDVNSCLVIRKNTKNE